jgi:hypothetical protein
MTIETVSIAANGFVFTADVAGPARACRSSDRLTRERLTGGRRGGAP